LASDATDAGLDCNSQVLGVIERLNLLEHTSSAGERMTVIPKHGWL